MAVTAGTVEYIKVGDDYGFVEIQDEGTSEVELFIIWFSTSGPGGPIGFWTLQLMMALAQGLPVEITHGDHSAFVEQVKVRAA
jgi:hypothetical protein